MDILNKIDPQATVQMIFTWLISSGVQILIIFVLMMVAVKISRRLTSGIFNRLSDNNDTLDFRRRADTLKSVSNYVITIVLTGIGTAMILGEIGVDLGPILATAGVLGLAIGFGAQSLVEDMISGFFIILENQIRVGDVVDIVGHAGKVEELNLRMTVLRDLEGKVHYVRNGQIKTVVNLTKDFSCYVFDIGIAYREDVNEAMAKMREVDEELRADEAFKDKIIEPLEIFGLDAFGDSAVMIKARYQTRPGEQWGIGREYKRRLKAVFDENDIEIPFPHVTLYMGRDKNGEAPPLGVENRKAVPSEN
ncbi:MAG TPA: mechanosensitive ion channel family protein [Calditrichia bacterium]|nr:mechanosensitive ion channel family protein [Calditrichota bacterium]HQU72287.1 mechanosensitive ion channel family protein [Calditrichia bacterium]HQV32001.1 mechanosensitive ion channel family protein [Calditrichia bacterium]